MMLNDFLRYIQSQDLIGKGDKILLAVSGGLDSMVMLHLFKNSSYSIGVSHCNFQLRGRESKEDESFVRSECKRLGLACWMKSFNTADYASEKGISIQMAARELRYSWFEEILGNEGFSKVALAHHKDDQLETIIFNISRGTGISGLTGIQPKTEAMIRPLLFANRQMIYDYAKEQDLSWREDSSNQSIKYKRNLIRHKIVPGLKELNPNLLETIDYTILRLIETESVLDESLLTFIKDGVSKKGDDIYISKKELEASLSPTLAIHAVAEPFGFNYQQCVNIMESIQNVGALFYAGKNVINIDRSELIISKLEDDDHSLIFEIQEKDSLLKIRDGILRFEVMESPQVHADSNVASLDYDKLQFPLRLRHWAAGDWFIPLGMKGKKKVSDLMIDEKIPLNLKSRVLILESGGEIVWVLGHRIDDRYKVTSATEKVWKATYEKALI